MPAKYLEQCAEYTESERELFGMKEVVRNYNNGDVEKRLEEFDWCKRKNVVRNRKVIHPDGSSEEYNFQNLKSTETLSDGTVRQFYSDGSVKSERLPDGTERWFYDNGAVCGEIDANGMERLYYENGRLSKIENTRGLYTVGYSKTGQLNFEIKEQDYYINPEYFSYYKIGCKTDITTEHWAENHRLNPRKKTLICLGGDATRNARAANGNINAALDALGFSGEECDKMQLAACYRPSAPSALELALRKADIDRAGLAMADYEKEIRRVFMPFMAKKSGGKFVMLSEKELFARCRNIMFFTHCAGADDLPIIEKTLKSTMTKLGYGKLAQKYALRQMLCVTNNSQREFCDKSDMTVIHRYSVWDGQGSGRYNPKTSADYGVFLEKYPPFHKYKGRMSGIINLRKNEALMIFDKVVKIGNDEHNAGFFTPEPYRLTKVGKWQAKLMQNIGQYWRRNKKAIPSAKEVIMLSSADDTALRQVVEQALLVGRKTRQDKMNVLENHFILSAAYEKFKHPRMVPESTGIYKILSAKAR